MSSFAKGIFLACGLLRNDGENSWLSMKTPLPRPNGTGLLASFLLLTLGLSCWLGYQAWDAARSHRQTAEGVLRDYAELAASEFTRKSDDRLGYLARWIFDDIPSSLRRRIPPPEVMENDLIHAVERLDCPCETLLEDARFFRIGFRDSSLVSGSAPFPSGSEVALVREVIRHRQTSPDSWVGIAILPPGSVFDSEGIALYSVIADQDRIDHHAFGMAVPNQGFGELWAAWYANEPVLPRSIAGKLPNDSLLAISVLAPSGTPIFESLAQYPGSFWARDTLGPERSSLVIQATIRPDAANHLIIGGLPNSRIPLLLGLMALTLGVGLAALHQIRKEHQLARLRDDFISSVSHEFRTPLTQIRLFAELLDDGKLVTPEEQKRSTGVINREARRLTHLVENILHFSLSRRTPVLAGEIEEIDVEAVLREVLDSFTPQARGKGVELSLESDPGLTVTASRGGVHRIMANLLDNALKYGPDGQSVRLRACGKGPMVRLSVEDEGPGIPLQDQNRIWDPYQRLERDVTGDVQGSGIGLSVVADLSARLQGRALVEDGGSGGARFVVELPRGETGRGTPPAASEAG